MSREPVVCAGFDKETGRKYWNRIRRHSSHKCWGVTNYTIPSNPAKKAGDGYRESVACTKILTESLLNRSDLDTVGYNSSITAARSQKMHKARALLGLAELQEMLAAV